MLRAAASRAIRAPLRAHTLGVNKTRITWCWGCGRKTPFLARPEGSLSDCHSLRDSGGGRFRTQSASGCIRPGGFKSAGAVIAKKMLSTRRRVGIRAKTVR